MTHSLRLTMAALATIACTTTVARAERHEGLIGTARLVFTRDAVTLDSVWYARGVYKGPLPRMSAVGRYEVLSTQGAIIAKGAVDDPWVERHEAPMDSGDGLTWIEERPDTIYRFVRFPSSGEDVRVHIVAPTRDRERTLERTLPIHAPIKPRD